MNTDSFDEHRFKRQVDAALQKIKTILDNTRTPQYPADVPHQYEDKYHLAEFLTNTGLAAVLNCLEALGVDEKKLKTMVSWAKTRSVTISLRAEEHCAYDRMEERKVESKTEHVTEIKGVFGNTTTISDKVVTTVKEYFWKFDAQYELFAYQGNSPGTRELFQSRKGRFEIKTTSDYTPKPSSVVRPSIETDITWLLQNITDELTLTFAINRSDARRCRTPRRNPHIESALSFFSSFYSWAGSVSSYFTGTLFPVQTNHGLDLSKINDTGIFIPVIPLFEEPPKDVDSNSSNSSSTTTTSGALVHLQGAAYTTRSVLRISDVNHYLAEQKRSINEKHSELLKMFVDTTQLITAPEAKILSVLAHSRQIGIHYSDGINYIENMLYKQLVAAIGKEVGSVDFTNYMRFHNRQLFKSEYEPRPFSFAVRRPEHYPEGTLTIEQQLADGTLAEPILTSVRSAQAVRPLHFLLNAATKVSFLGERHLHAWLATEFAGYSGSTLSLISRARQFSSFIVLIGSVVSADLFEPKYAFIAQNKDEVKIPIELSKLPTPQEFSDAIESLSPEQQRFALAFRSMQLASTLFGVCIIQIKPQLEKLLKLPEDSLTKEIQLTQDLMELFIKYQIPSDLISFGGNPNTSDDDKVKAVKGHVAAMQDMIKFSREKELAEQRQQTAYAVLDSLSSGNNYSSNSSRTSILPAPARARVHKFSSAAAFSDPTDEFEQSQQAPAGYEEDLTALPAALDRKFEILDKDNALRPTVIGVGTSWTKTSQKSLLSGPTTESIASIDQHKSEKNRTFDLLDALSRSGALSCDYTDFHVFLAATHSFEKSLMDTVIKDNVNPIEKAERSTLIVATTVHGKPAIELVKPDQLERVSTYSPALFGPPRITA